MIDIKYMLRLVIHPNKTNFSFRTRLYPKNFKTLTKINHYFLQHCQIDVQCFFSSNFSSYC